MVAVGVREGGRLGVVLENHSAATTLPYVNRRSGVKASATPPHTAARRNIAKRAAAPREPDDPSRRRSRSRSHQESETSQPRPRPPAPPPDDRSARSRS